MNKEEKIFTSDGKTGILSIIGFMGCGKTSAGRELSALVSCPFTDLDEYIESREGRSIPAIFASDGEPGFRALELSYLKEILQEISGQTSHPALDAGSPKLVLSLGGGTVVTPECARLIRENTFCVYLRTSTDTLVQRLATTAVDRPMLNRQENPGQTSHPAPDTESLRARIETLMQQRSAIYESTAHHIIDTDGKSIPALAEEIIMSKSIL